jgi:nitroimidazol reductase NimA-like FMN-containing flavoprotein (pyridoxamine 5'-phosphate oxidase superfamily)
MANREPVIEQSIATNGIKTVTPWTEASEQLEQASTYWLATVKPNGQPHVMPVLGVWLDSALYFTSGEAARKARNLARNSHCVITAAGRNLDLVVEGEAVKVRDEAELQRVADRYASKYGWRVTVRDGAYFADYGAPSAGPPPYELYKVQPATVFGLGTDEPYGATRWRFS